MTMEVRLDYRFRGNDRGDGPLTLTLSLAGERGYLFRNDRGTDCFGLRARHPRLGEDKTPCPYCMASQ